MNGASNPPPSNQSDSIATSDIAIPSLPDAAGDVASHDAGSRDMHDGATEAVDTSIDANAESLTPGVCDVPEDCPCTSHEECAPYDEMDLCAGVHLCTEGACVIQSETRIVCPEHQHACKRYACDPKLGLCLEEDRKNGDVCDDGDPCTEADICLVMKCSGQDIICDDGNPCTQDACVDGLCEAGDTCNDGNPCTIDVCQPDGNCTFEPNPCDDEDKCTYDECIITTGDCTHDTVACEDDGDPCTDVACDATNGCTYPDNGVCDVDFEMVNEEIFEKKCVPCHADGGSKRNFVGKSDKLLGVPQNSQCQNLPQDLPYTLAACIYWLTVGAQAMPPPWYQAETLLSGDWTQALYEADYTLTEAEKELLQQWADVGFAN